MKVLHVIPSVSPAYGGPSRAIVEIERALGTRGVKVTTVTTDDDGAARRLNVPYDTPISTPEATRWYFRRNTRFYSVSFGLARWLMQNIRSFDLVHVHALFSFPPVAAAFIAYRLGVPYILRPLGVLSPYGVTQRRPHLKKISLALLERRLIKHASAVHFTSIMEQDEAAALGVEFESVVIPLGIDLKELETPSADQSRERSTSVNLLYLSRIDPKKNLDSLFRAFASVTAKYPKVRLRIAGDGKPEYISRLKALARQLGIANAVSWLGYVEGQRKVEILSTSFAFILPSFSENFGIAVVEALAAGLPCIVSDGVAVSREIKTARAGIVTSTDPASIALGIEEMLNSKDNYDVVSASARELAATAFSVETMGARLEELYGRIASEQAKYRRRRDPTGNSVAI